MSIKEQNKIEINENAGLAYVGMELGRRKVSLGDLKISSEADALNFVAKVAELAHKLNDSAGLDRFEGGIIYVDAAIAQLTNTRSPIPTRG